ncbi:hypothetical protein HN419_02750 [Candidatus Woesearchaeota archaeon]|jgi:hypothetical protein|nr:hypothetical protein [Candidatus Woesearchaeota archaeon]MBT3537083.1 hypothetical protein [Candidatus Woesearchaeota archaeon]MBT4697232.1 hypothetical protein [Candidatus Woesearchaeota archaeon]MBT4717003.1 hypothetical protein [Candidatus Woesearchaeota archaeon]MBT7106607.1 hypothetical protein [Candidatus Woesearchaeota archaeon]
MNKKRTVIGVILVLVALLMTVQAALATGNYYNIPTDFNLKERGSDLGNLNLMGSLEDPYYDTFMHINLKNKHNFPLDHVNLVVWIPDLNLYTRTASFTVYENDMDFGKYIWLDTPMKVRPDTYLARVLLESEFGRIVSWQYVDIY